MVYLRACYRSRPSLGAVKSSRGAPLLIFLQARNSATGEWFEAEAGTELAFEEDLRCESACGFSYKRLPHKIARFRQVNKEQPNVHHDEACDLEPSDLSSFNSERVGARRTPEMITVTPRANVRASSSLNNLSRSA